MNPTPPDATFDCSKVRHLCHGECCGPCPVPAATWQKYRHIATEPLAHELLDDDGFVHVVTVSGACPFKSPLGSCLIYPAAGCADERAPVCALFGGEGHPALTCRWMDRTGRVRPRWERRELSRTIAAYTQQTITALKQRTQGKRHT